MFNNKCHLFNNYGVKLTYISKSVSLMAMQGTILKDSNENIDLTKNTNHLS